MSVTLTANYKEVFKSNTVEKIDELVEDNYALDDILEFIDAHNEEDFVAHYEAYVEAGEDIGYDVVDKFIEEFGVDCIEHCAEAYQGQYDSESDFAEQLITELYGEVSPLVVVDWDATFERNLYYDYTFVDGYVFNKNF